MTANAGQLINLQGGKHKAYVTWARPPIYFCQLLVDPTTGALPTVHHGHHYCQDLTRYLEPHRKLYGERKLAITILMYDIGSKETFHVAS